MTNRDKFNGIHNDVLADMLCSASDGGIKCKFCCYSSGNCFEKNKSCLDGIKKWLSGQCANESEKQPVDLQKVSEKVCDNVNHPSHYTSGQIEVIDFIEDKGLGFHLGNAVKYISRAGRKNPDKTIEDLQKAVWYINRQIERLEMSLGGQNA